MNFGLSWSLWNSVVFAKYATQQAASPRCQVQGPNARFRVLYRLDFMDFRSGSWEPWNTAAPRDVTICQWMI